jgi:hypothetical protein
MRHKLKLKDKRGKKVDSNSNKYVLVFIYTYAYTYTTYNTHTSYIIQLSTVVIPIVIPYYSKYLYFIFYTRLALIVFTVDQLKGFGQPLAFGSRGPNDLSPFPV